MLKSKATLTRIFQSIKRPLIWKRLPLFGLGICFVLLSHVYRFPAAAQPVELTEATISEITQGKEIQIQNRPTSPGDLLRTSQQIRTGESLAQVRFNNWAIARLDRNSALTIAPCGADVDLGRVLFNGPTAACADHLGVLANSGTYIMEVDRRGNENIDVLEGDVEVVNNWNGQANRVIVKSGETFESSASNPQGIVRTLSMREFDEILTSDLFNSYRSSLPSYSLDRIETTYKRQFPNTRFPLKRTDLKPHRGHFNLNVLQNNPNLSDVIARVSLASKRSNGFLPERFVGDFLYPINGTARFIRGLNPGDRAIIRLFNPQTSQLLGYSEFELLDDNALVNLILPERSQDFGILRTVMGIDSDRNGAIDLYEPIFDYFTRVNYADNNDFSKYDVSFLDNSDNIDLRYYRPTRFNYAFRKPAYARSFVVGDSAKLNRTWSIFPRDAEELILATPLEKVKPIAIGLDGSSTYDVPVEILKYRRR